MSKSVGDALREVSEARTLIRAIGERIGERNKYPISYWSREEMLDLADQYQKAVKDWAVKCELAREWGAS